MALAAGVTFLAVASTAHAHGAVLPRVSTASTVPVDVSLQIAVAVTPTGTTRWARFTAATTEPVLWLVPVRAGSRLDQAGDALLDALDAATRPRVLPPEGETPPACPQTTRAAEIHGWGMERGAASVATNPLLLEDISTARAHVAARGYALPSSLVERASTLYSRGFVLAAMEVAGRAPKTTSPSLRVSGDGEAELPLALTGAGTGTTYVTAFVIGSGQASVARSGDVSFGITWNGGSDYVDGRSDQLRSGDMLREASGHDLLFTGLAVAGARVPSVLEGVFSPLCAARAEAYADHTGTVGGSCAAGALATIPGGTPCTPAAGTISASAFTCDGKDDLALALGGTRPRDAVVTRFVGFLDRGEAGSSRPILGGGSTSTSPVKRATVFSCPASGSTSPSYPAADPTVTTETSGGGDLVVVSDGCSGSSTVAYDEDDSPTTSSSSGWDDGDDDASSSSSSDSCSSDSPSGSSGWDSSDSSSDGCSSSSDGWDSSDSDSCSSESTSTSKRGPSPLSRITLIAAALVLPLRRRLKGRARADFRA